MWLYRSCLSHLIYQKWLCLSIAFSKNRLILWGETSDSAHFFLVRATEKTNTFLDQKIPNKLITWAVNVYSNISKNRFFQKTLCKNLKTYLKYKKNFNINRFHSIVLSFSVLNSFHFLCSPLKEKCASLEVFPLLGGVNSHHPGKMLNNKYKHNPGIRGAISY